MRVFLIFLAILSTLATGALLFLTMQPDLITPALVTVLPSATGWCSWAAIVSISLLLLGAIIGGVWRHIAPVFGESIAARLLSFGVVALVFSDTVSSVIYPVMRFVVDLTLVLPAHLSEASQLFTDTDMTSNAPPDYSFSAVIARPFDEFGRGLLSINYAWIFVALAVWALAGQLLSAAMRTAPGSTTDSAWSQLIERLRGTQVAAWQNILLFAIITVGGLLSVSALITLPLLSQANPLSADELKRIETDFDTIIKVDDKSSLFALDLPISDSVTKDLEDLAKRIAAERDRQKARATQGSAQVQEAAAATATYGLKPALTTDQALELLDRIEKQRASIVRDQKVIWNESQSLLKRALETARGDALLAVRRQNYAPGGTRSEYVAQVGSWLNDKVSAVKSNADYCRTELVSAIEMFLNTSKSQLDSLENDYSMFSTSSFYMRPYQCTANIAYRDQPDEHHLTLGAFGFSAWLINLDSLPLTLIAGMLGFGLVGAAVSSVIRERKDRDGTKPLVVDITGILVRGLSATIVVYLAVKGGLVIFTAGSAGEPDPHVLLLTCLVASVFSEDVWAAARERFVSKLKGDQGAQQAENVNGQANQQPPVS